LNESFRTSQDLNESFKTPRGGKIAEIRGLAGSTPAKERQDGFAKGIEGRGIDIVTTVDGDWLREKGQQQADAIFKSHPEIQAVYSQNDPMAEGAYLAAKAPSPRRRRCCRRSSSPRRTPPRCTRRAIADGSHRRHFPLRRPRLRPQRNRGSPRRS
jgi:hypothetical protein